MKTILIISLLVTLPLLLTGCDATKTALGINKSTPDEFRVITRAPLTLPPNYQLVPPQPGKQRPQEMTSYQQAQRVLLGKQTKAQPIRSGNMSAEQTLLAQAGVRPAPENIRQIVDQEANSSQSLKDAFLQKPTANTQTVNAVKERERLLQQGANRNNDVPVVVEAPKPWWKRLF